MPPAVDVGQYYAGTLRLGPELFLALGVAVILLYEAFAKPSSTGRRPAQLAIGFLAGALCLSLFIGGEKATLFSGMVVLDPYVAFFRVVFCLIGIVGVVITLRSDEIAARYSGEYYAMFLALVLGMLLMASASDLVMIFIAVELMSLMSYVLAGFRRNDRKSAEAALKYVIYGGAASGAMIFGFSLIYGLTGETQLSMIREQIALIATEAARTGLADPSTRAAMPVALSAALVLSFAGFAYKIAAAPLHMWSPDVYEGAPTPFTAFLSTGPKAAGFAVLLRFFLVGFSNLEEANLLSDISTLPWILLVIAVSMLTMTIGNFAAIGQSNIKRFLAYSSIAHAGYALVGLAAFSRAGAQSVLIYMAFYMVMNMGAFYAVIWVREKTGSDLIDSYRGLGTRAPFIAISMAICLFSLTGLPPLAGFIGKYYLFAAVIERGIDFAPLARCAPELRDGMTMMGRVGCSLSGGGVFYALGIVAVINSAVSLYYYARIVRKMFLDTAEDATPIPVETFSKAVLIPICAFLLVFGIYWTPLEKQARDAISFEQPTVETLQRHKQVLPSKRLAELKRSETSTRADSSGEP